MTPASMQLAIGNRQSAIALLLLAFAGCLPQPPPAPEAPALVRPPERPATIWPTILVSTLPGEFTPPWASRPGERLEMWQIDLLDLDRPDVSAWLQAWPPRREKLARPVAVQVASEAPLRLRVAERGAYILSASAGGEAHRALVIASPIRALLTLYDADCEVLCADAQTGKPVRGAYVHLVYRTERLGRERVLAASGTTDSDGRWHTSLVRDRFAPGILATAVACFGSDYALATERRHLSHSHATARITLRARSPILRPGQTAELAGVLSTPVSTRRFVPWPDTALRLSLIGPDGTLAGVATARTDDAGCFTAAFELKKDAAPGPYSLAAAAEKGTGTFFAALPPRPIEAFSVAAATPMPFRLKVALDRAVVAPGEALEIKIEAERADGSPVANAPVRLLSWGYPVALDGSPAWASATEPLDPARLVVLPIQLPSVSKTDAQGRLALRWQPTRAELHPEDLLCGLRVEVADPELGAAERSAEFVLRRRVPAIGFARGRAASSPLFARPGEPIEMELHSPLPPAEQAGLTAVCRLTQEDRDGVRRTREVIRAPVAWLATHHLKTIASSPGLYSFSIEADGVADAVSVWVVDGEKDVYWSGASEPMLLAERPWVRRGEGLQAILAAPGREAPLALTLRTGQRLERKTAALRTGARGLWLEARPNDLDPLEVHLAQVAGGNARIGRAEFGIEPGGQTLDVQPRLLWVRQGEWSGRGYGVTVRNRLGRPTPAVVHIELIRPTFLGLPPTGLHRHTLHWHPGKATGEGGDIEVGFHDSLLAAASTLLVEAGASDGARGLLLMSLHQPAYPAGLAPGSSLSPRERLDALVNHGLDAPLAEWLAARLLAAHPELDAALPALLAAAKSDDQAIPILRLAAARPAAALPMLRTALERGGAAALTALALLPQPPDGSEPAAAFQATLAEALAGDANPLVRAAAARALARALPASRKALVEALEGDGEAIVRAAAATALAGAGQAVLPALADAARRDNTASVRLAAIGAIQRIGGMPAATALLDLAAAPLAEAPSAGQDGETALAALRALGETGYVGADARLLRILDAGPADARLETARIIVRTDSPEPVARLIAAARHSPTGPLVRALAPLRSRAVQTLAARLLSHADPEVRLAAAECLAALEDERAPAALRAFLEPGVAPQAADRAAAALLALRDTAAAPKLFALLDAGRLSPQTRRAAVQMAGKLGLQEAGPALIAILWRGLAEPARLRQPDERQLWAAALDAAGTVGPIWSPLIEAAVGPAPASSPYAPALSTLRTSGLPAFLACLWRSPLPDDLRRQTVLPFARLRGLAGATELIELLDSPALQGPAIQALAEIGAVDALLAALPGASPARRAAAAAALGATGEARAVTAIQPLLADADPFVRCEAAHALAAITRQPVPYTDSLGESRQAKP